MNSEQIMAPVVAEELGKRKQWTSSGKLWFCDDPIRLYLK